MSGRGRGKNRQRVHRKEIQNEQGAVCADGKIAGEGGCTTPLLGKGGGVRYRGSRRLCRSISGVGALDLVDSDTVCESNLNRQIIALHSTIGRSKTEVMRERIFDINPQINVNVYNCFFMPQNAGEFPFPNMIMWWMR